MTGIHTSTYPSIIDCMKNHVIGEKVKGHFFGRKVIVKSDSGQYNVMVLSIFHRMLNSTTTQYREIKKECKNIKCNDLEDAKLKDNINKSLKYILGNKFSLEKTDIKAKSFDEIEYAELVEYLSEFKKFDAEDIRNDLSFFKNIATKIADSTKFNQEPHIIHRLSNCLEKKNVDFEGKEDVIKKVDDKILELPIEDYI